MYFQIDTFLALLVAVSILAILARRFSIPYPILLVLGGLALAIILEFFPNIPKIRLEPDLVFFFFLPPLLFPAALFTSWRDFRANLRPILQLAVGLVLFTTVSVGYFAHYLVASLPLAGAFVLGAIISPPDAVAATAVAERVSLTRRIVTIIEGESLVNDAIALVAYQFAVNALVTGSFSLADASWRFVAVSVGGILMGLVMGWLGAQLQKRLDDPPVQITLSILTPFAAYVSADQLGASGILSVVTAGLYFGWRTPEIVGSRMRLQAGPVWEMIEFLLNGVVFILIGLQLPAVWNGLAGLPVSKARLITDSLLITAMTIVVRFAWVFAATYLPRLLSKKLRQRDPYPNWRSVLIVAWTGMRGVVSLAAALALPSAVLNDSSSAEKNVMVNVIIFFTYVVILVTLVLQGLTLPVLIRWLNVTDTGETDREEREARLKANLAAMARLAELEEHDHYPEEFLRRLRVEYEDRIRQLESFDESGEDDRHKLFSDEFERLEQEALDVERRTIIQLRNERVINDTAMRRIQHDIDLAEARLRGRE